MSALTVVKFGGELLEDPESLKALVLALSHVVSQGHKLVIVHGGGKEIDRALQASGIAKRQVDGLRITDDATLEVVVAVLSGVNTKLVAALAAAGVAAVGMTGADAACGLSEQAPPHRTVDGRLVDLGHVGIPSERADLRWITTAVSNNFVPVIACIGIGADGRLFNINADTLAGRLAARLGARRLVIAGTTPGVLDASGATIPVLDGEGMARLIADRTATAGMIAKLRACEDAVQHGAGDVVIVDGRNSTALEAAALGSEVKVATRIVAGEQVRQ